MTDDEAHADEVHAEALRVALNWATWIIYWWIWGPYHARRATHYDQ